MTTNPTPVRGEVWRIRFDPSEGDEIKKVRLAVVISENAVGRLRLKICSSNNGMENEVRELTVVRPLSTDINQWPDKRIWSRCVSSKINFGDSLSGPTR